MRSFSAKPQGFSLIELMVVLAVFGIMSMYAVPYFQEILETKDFNTAKNTVIYSLNKAKKMASARNTFVDVELENSQIQISAKNSNKTEHFRLPKNIVFPDKQNLTFSANGVIVTGDNGNSADSSTNILIKHKNKPTKQETVYVTTTGMVAEL